MKLFTIAAISLALFAASVLADWHLKAYALRDFAGNMKGITGSYNQEYPSDECTGEVQYKDKNGNSRSLRTSSFRFNKTNPDVICCLWAHKDARCARGEDNVFLGCDDIEMPFLSHDLNNMARSFQVRCAPPTDIDHMGLMRLGEEEKVNLGACPKASRCSLKWTPERCHGHCESSVYSHLTTSGCFWGFEKCCCYAT